MLRRDLTVLANEANTVLIDSVGAVAEELLVTELVLQTRDTFTTVVAEVLAVVARLVLFGTAKAREALGTLTVLSQTAVFDVDVERLSVWMGMVGKVGRSPCALGPVEARERTKQISIVSPDRNDGCEKQQDRGLQSHHCPFKQCLLLLVWLSICVRVSSCCCLFVPLFVSEVVVFIVLYLLLLCACVCFVRSPGWIDGRFPCVSLSVLDKGDTCQHCLCNQRYEVRVSQ